MNPAPPSRSLDLEFVEYQFDDGVATLTLNRPERLNAISPALARDLLGALSQAKSDGARLVSLRGAGRAFCAGHDLKEADPAPGSPESEEHLATLQAITRALVAPEIISVATLHGYVLGAGAEVALACDVIVAGSSTTMAFPEVSVGLSVTGGGSYFLPQLVGLLRAKKLILLGESLDAQTALEWGLVTQVVEDADLSAATTAMVEILGALPQHSLRLAKTALVRSAELGLEATMALEVDNARETLTSEDLRRTRKAFWGERD